MRSCLIQIMVVLLGLFSGSVARAAWSTDSTLGTPVLLLPGDLNEPQMVSDGAGGFIVMWTDYRKPTFDPDLYCQRVGANGDTLWSGGGVVVCDAAGVQTLSSIIADGQGGAFMAWMDSRSGNAGYFVQHIGFDGVRRWAANGIKPVSGFNSQIAPRICRDTTGGIFLAFTSANGTQIQRLDSLGIKRISVFPPAEGTVVRANPSSPMAIVPDGIGGAIVAVSHAGDISAQRVTSAGALVWPAGGSSVCAATGNQGAASMVSDGANGAILAWVDDRTAPSDLYAQRIPSGGTAAWTPNGVALCVATGVQDGVLLVPMPDGGAVAVWRDQRNASAWSLYAQRVSAAGDVAWALDGAVVCSSTLFIQRYSAAFDASDNVFAAWNSSQIDGAEVFAQKLDGAGVRQWGEYGATVCRGPLDQTSSAAVSDGLGGLFVSYRDRRSGDADLWAHHLGPGGTPGPVAGVPWRTRSAREALAATPNPARAAQELRFARALSARGRIEVLDITGRRHLARSLPAGASFWSWDGRGDDGARVEPGIYFVRVIDAGQAAVARIVRIE